MGRQFRRSLAIAAVVLAAGGGLFLILRPQPVLVETEPVTRGRFEAVVEEDGRTRVRDRYLVSAPVAGRVMRIAVRPGDAVEAGQAVATILASPSSLLSPRARREAEERIGAAEAALEQAEALTERAAVTLAQAETEAQRLRALHASGVAPQQTLERTELAYRVAVREHAAAERRRHGAEHELALARAALQGSDSPTGVRESRSVRSPIAGRVLRVVQESEAVVPGGAPLIELGDPGDLEVVVDVLTTEAVSIRPGAAVRLERWGGAGSLAGRVRLVEPGAFTRVSALGVEEQRVWVVIDLVEPRERWAALGDGFRVDARITVETLEDALLVPVSALFRRGPDWAAFIVQDGIARERRVEIARRAARNAIVTGGLSAGETVVVFPPSALRDGGRVRRAP